MNRTGVAALLCAAWTVAGPVLAAETPCDATAPGVRLSVIIDKVQTANGAMAVTVYPDDHRRFLAHHGQIGAVHAAAATPSTTACVQLPSPGFYAVVVYQDLNSDGRFNRNAIGFPTEPYGLSNDPPNLLGLPTFKSVRVAVHAGETTIHVPLHRPPG